MEHSIPAPPAPPTTRGSRIGAFFLSTTLTFLWIWLLAFLLEDVGRMSPVSYDEIYAAGMPSELVEELSGVDREVRLLERGIERQEQIQGVLKRDMETSGEVMGQMMDLQRLALEKGSVPSEAERDALATAQETFLSSQGQYREANIEIQSANRTLFGLQQRRTGLETRKAAAEAPIQKSYRAKVRVRALMEACVRLGILIPLFLVAAATVRRRWRHPWRPIYQSFLVATFWTLGYEMFEQFPALYFKYIAILTAIGITIAFLAWIIRKSTSPSPSLVLARNRAAYMESVCPVCAFKLSRTPIQGAPAVKRRGQAPQEPAGPLVPEGRVDFSCPSCGTGVFEACGECSGSRHSLLPFCEGCGAESPEALVLPSRAGAT
jgi:predicted RNA-binding Zn-ribbon protein involved in translation (DUF1610 family)